MCCRYLLSLEALRAFATRHALDLPPDFATRYNIAPGSMIPVLRQKPRAAGCELALLRWGLVPAWTRAETRPEPPVNARAETLATKPSFREAFARRRCLIPADGFYEWQAAGRALKPHLFRRGDGRPFCFAGLWETWRTPENAVLETCAIVTTGPNELMRPIHHRQPFILPESAHEGWLDARLTAPDALAPLLRPFPAEEFTAVELDGRVNNTRHDDPACLTPAPAVALESDDSQLSLDL